MITAMIFKNVLLFVLGIVFATICYSLISAFHLYKSVQSNLVGNLRFIEDKETGTVYWNEFPNYKSALDAWYIALLRRIFGSKKQVCYSNNTRARLLFLLSPVVLALVMVLAVWLVLHIHTL